MVIGGTQYQDAVNLIIALQQLNYQPRARGILDRTDQPRVRRCDRRCDRGHPRSPPAIRRSRSSPATSSSSRSTPRCTANPPSEDEANAYTTGQVVAAAVEAAGCAEQGECQQELIDWLRDNSVDTVVGELSWDETGKPTGAHLIQQWIDGEILIVLPDDVKEADFLFPKPTW